MFARASRGGCAPLVEDQWGDPATAPTDEMVCYTASLGPSPLAWLVMAAVFVIALGRVRRATEVSEVSRTLLWTSRAMPLIALGGAVLGFWWFFSLSESMFVSGTFAPFVEVTIDVHPAGP